MEIPSARLSEALSAVAECQRVVAGGQSRAGGNGRGHLLRGFRRVDDRFSSWLHGTFQREILPGLVHAVRLGSDEKGRELLECDAGMLRNATELLRNGSGRAGRLLLRQGVPAG